MFRADKKPLWEVTFIKQFIILIILAISERRHLDRITQEKGGGGTQQEMGTIVVRMHWGAV
jgi:hypothetical protein